MVKVTTGWKRPSLKDYAFFSACSEGFMNAIKKNLCTRLFLPGEKVVTEGDEGESCFLLQHGEAEALKGTTLVHSFKPGAIFGEFVMLGLTQNREATVHLVLTK
jgi:cAMP-dependent protein kinase regulator